MSQEALAEAVRVSQPTVWEWEANKSTPKRFRVKSIASALQTTPEWIERGDVSAKAKYETLTVVVPIIGSVQAGAWMEAYQLPEGEWEIMHLPADSRFPGITRYGLRVAGPSVNKIAEDGGVIVFVRYDEIGLDPKDTDYVIVERIRRDGLVEATCKQLRADRSGKMWLWPDSTDPRHQTPLTLEGDGEVAEIRIVGRVIKTVKDL